MTIEEYAKKHGIGIRRVYDRIYEGELETYKEERLVELKNPCKCVLYEGEYIPLSYYSKIEKIPLRTAHHHYDTHKVKGKVTKGKIPRIVTCVKQKELQE